MWSLITPLLLPLLLLLLQNTASQLIPTADMSTITLLHQSVSLLTGISDRLVEVESSVKKVSVKINILDASIHNKENTVSAEKEEQQRQLGLIFNKMAAIEFELGGFQQHLENVKKDLDFMKKGYSGVFQLVTSAAEKECASFPAPAAGGRRGAQETRAMGATMQRMQDSLQAYKAALDSIQSGLLSLNGKLGTKSRSTSTISKGNAEASVLKLEEAMGQLTSRLEGFILAHQPKSREGNIHPRDCSAIQEKFRTKIGFDGVEGARSGLYKIQPDRSMPAIWAYCDMDIEGGGWTVVQNRLNGQINFHSRNQLEYSAGFGNLGGEFWLGLDSLHALTEGSEEVQELLIQLTDAAGKRATARYAVFGVGNRASGHRLSMLGGYSGTAGDSLVVSQGAGFSTQFPLTAPGCTEEEEVGGWWYPNSGCPVIGSNLNGRYHVPAGDLSPELESLGLFWNTFHGPVHSLAKTRMMIRPVRNKL